eukprot:scaffold22933_cov196-Cylindrotheca_fusiformis.AAC.1
MVLISINHHKNHNVEEGRSMNYNDMKSRYDFESNRVFRLDSDDTSSTCSSQPTPGRKSSASVSVDSLPAWLSSSRSQQDDASQDQSVISVGENTSLIFTARRRKKPLYIGVVVFCVIGLILYIRSHSTLHNAVAQASSLTSERRTINTQFKIVEHDLRKFQRTIVRLSQRQSQKSQESSEERNHAIAEMSRLQESVQGANKEISLLQKHIQETSRKDALEKYGSGVIRVELELAFPGDAEGPNSMVFEMASLEEMPHSVFMFLSMVDAKLFDGCSFILNAMDIIKAAPLPYDGGSAASKVKAFTRAGLESVAFREYSPNYPHTKYTVGFAVDGSPSFFINTNDNTALHEGDPCFAKIVSGFDAVRRLEAAPTRNDGMWYKHRIGAERETTGVLSHQLVELWHIGGSCVNTSLCGLRVRAASSRTRGGDELETTAAVWVLPLQDEPSLAAVSDFYQSEGAGPEYNRHRRQNLH